VVYGMLNVRRGRMLCGGIGKTLKMNKGFSG
jgi:hypothetical protein